MKKLLGLLLICTFAFVFMVFVARFYLEKPYYFSFSKTINSEYAWMRKVSLYFLSIRMDDLSFEDSKNLLQEVLFPSILGVPENWSLSNESVRLFCNGVDGNSLKYNILLATAINASYYQDEEVLKFLNTFIDLNDLILDFNNSVDKNFIKSLDENVRKVIEKRETGTLKCPEKE